MNRTIKNVAILAVGAFALGLPGVARAAEPTPPEFITYQGYLVDGDGNPLGADRPANYGVVFRIYKANQGGTAIWAEQQTVTVDKGYFSVLLGQGAGAGTGEPRDPLSTVFQGSDISDRFIGITVDAGDGGDTEIAPRLRFLTSPFAFTARQALRVTDANGGTIFKQSDETVSIGAGDTPRLSLDAAGNATFSGSLTADLPDAGTGLQLNHGSNETLLEVDNDSLNFKTTLPRIDFDQSLRVVEPDSQEALLELRGTSQGTGRLYLGQSLEAGGGIAYPGDGTPAFSGGTTDHVSFYRRVNGVDHEVFKYPWNSNDVTFNGDIALGVNGALKVPADNGLINVYSGSDSSSPYLFMTAKNRSSNNNKIGFRIHSSTAYEMHQPSSADTCAHRFTGNVGIGTSSPDSELHIYNSSLFEDVTLYLDAKLSGYWHANSSAGGALRGTAESAGAIKVGSEVGNNYEEAFMSFWTCNDPRSDGVGGRGVLEEKMRITSGGLVGIGTTSPSQRLHVQGNIFASGTITPSSDRRAKTDLEPVDPKEVLERVVDLPIERWRFKTEDEGVKHVGPMAQDFHEAFGLGESDTAIATVDADGVAFAAIQGLNLKLNEKEAEIDSLETRNRGLEAEMETLQDEVALLKASLSRLEELVGKMGQGL